MRRLALPFLVWCAFPSSARATTVGPIATLGTSPANAAQRAPAVAWDGTRYVVVWEDGRSASSGLDLYLARLDPSGTVLDPMGIPLLSPAQPGDQTQPGIAYSAMGAAFFISWVDPRAGSPHVYAARFL